MSNLLKPDIAPDPRARCHDCGAMSYRRVIARDAAGRLMPNGLYQCTGCALTFEDPRTWHGLPSRKSVAGGTPPVLAPAPPGRGLR